MRFPFVKRSSGFSISEVLLASSILTVIITAVLLTSNVALNTFSRIMAIDTSHLEARSGIQSLLNEIHRSVAVPQLVDVEMIGGRRFLVPAPNSAEKAVGLALQRMVQGPFTMNDTAAVGTNTLKVRVVPQSRFLPSASHMLLVPSNGIEKFISSVSTYSDYAYPVVIEDSDGLNSKESIQVSAPSTAANTVAQDSVVLAYFTQPIAFVAIDGELRRFVVDYDSTKDKPFLVGEGAVVTTGLLAEEPDQPGVSYRPFARAHRNSSGAADANNVAAVNIMADDPSVSNLGYTGTSMFLNAKIPLRFKMAGRNTIRASGSEAN